MAAAAWIDSQHNQIQIQCTMYNQFTIRFYGILYKCTVNAFLYFALLLLIHNPTFYWYKLLNLVLYLATRPARTATQFHRPVCHRHQLQCDLDALS